MIQTKTFISTEEIRSNLEGPEPTWSQFDSIIKSIKKLKGLSLEEVKLLLRVRDETRRSAILHLAGWVKDQIYGKRIVLFAPLYLGNICSNNCLYCGFRKDNHSLVRRQLNQHEIAQETQELIKEGHKRLMVLNGETDDVPLDYILESIKTIYAQSVGKNRIRRINLEIAPPDVEDFKKLATVGIGTYVCFQETYDPDLYARVHPSGPKSDYEWRLYAMDRAMAGGLEDVGIGALFGLGDWRFEVLAMFEHAHHLEKTFGCGPHTVSVPRLEPAEGAPLSTQVPHPVSDEDFKYLVALLRVSLPYVGIILSTREKPELRRELFHYGVSQISAGSRTNPGAYSGDCRATPQFSLGDHRSLAEVIDDLIDNDFVPSFCTGCYRRGRVGADFMDLAKPGLIQHYCLPNGLLSFQEYLEDFAPQGLKQKGETHILKITQELEKNSLKKRTQAGLQKIKEGQRDVYY
jgi:2-iminoacetate synthase